MKASTCAKNSRAVKSMKYLENKMVEVLDRRKKTGKDNEDSHRKNMQFTSQGARVWNF